MATLYMLIGSKKAFYWVKPTVWQFLLFASVALASNFLFSWVSSDEGSLFNVQGLISYLVWPMIMLVSGIILANRHQNGMLVLVPAILWLVADTIMALLQSLIQLIGQQNWLPEWSYAVLPKIFSLLFVWQSLSLLWIFSRQLRWPWWERALILVGAFAVLTVWQKNVQSQPIFKVEPVMPTMTEKTFYEQPMILSDVLSNLQANRNNVTDWYFLGVAGFADQDVFRSEIEQTKDLFDVRFGTQGRSVALINNPDTLETQPIASKTSVEIALNRIGQLMNPDEDVLFLVLSSHGAEDVVQMENPPLDLENIDPAWLKQTLDNAGIKWRVLVVSACYSGSFIDELQSPTTLIITASAKDKSSFGCSNEADYTYFGQAFFAESLRHTTHFADAFNEAKQSIAKREADMHFEPSNPQFVVGSLMQNALPAFEKALIPQPEPAEKPKSGKNGHKKDPQTIQLTLPPEQTPAEEKSAEMNAEPIQVDILPEKK